MLNHEVHVPLDEGRYQKVAREAEPMDLPADPTELRRELDASRDRLGA